MLGGEVLDRALLEVGVHLDLVHRRHDLHDVALSVPTMVSSKGIERVLDVPLDDSEVAKLKSSAAMLRETLSSLGF